MKRSISTREGHLLDDELSYLMSGWTPLVQPFCDEPIWGATLLQWAGTFSAGVKSGFVGLLVGGAGGLAMRGDAMKEAEQRAGGLPRYSLIAVGDRNVYVFEFDPKAGREFRPKEPVQIWPRGDLQVRTEVKRGACLFAFRVLSTGASHELETSSMAGTFKKINTFMMFALESGMVAAAGKPKGIKGNNG